MTHLLKYDLSKFRYVVEKSLGLKNIVFIDSTVRSSVEAIIVSLSLENFITLSNAFVIKHEISITLESRQGISHAVFTQGVITFQEHFKTTIKSQIPHIEILINDAKDFLSTLPADYEALIGVTVKEEGKKKTEHNLPTYWYYKYSGGGNQAHYIHEYFVKQGLVSIESQGSYIYLIGMPKAEVEKLRKSQKAEYFDMKYNNAQMGGLMLIIIAVVAFVISIFSKC